MLFRSPKVQRRLAQLIQEDRFYTEEEQDRFDDIDPIAIREALEERGSVNGQVADPEKQENDQKVMSEVEQEANEETEHKPEYTASDREYAREHLIPGETIFEMDGHSFLVDWINYDAGTVSFQDITFTLAPGFPLFQMEPISVVRQWLEQEIGRASCRERV